jgi:signal transduction histidine kinase
VDPRPATLAGRLNSPDDHLFLPLHIITPWDRDGEGAMSNNTDNGNKDDLAFIGKVNASISHELKNSMAVISETAGLLKDLTEMAQKGKKIDLEMVNTCSEDIIEEIQRSFTIIKQMNAFSHSADEPVRKINLLEVIELIIGLSKFLTFSSKVRFDPVPGEAPVVLTCPIRLQHLIYRGLVYAFRSAGTDGQIVVGLKPNRNGGACISFSDFGSSAGHSFASDKMNRIAASIGIDIQEADNLQRFELVVPEDFRVVQQ